MNKLISISILGILLLSGISVVAITAMKASTDNSPPNTPVISGPAYCTIGGEYIFGLVTTDPDSDDVYYLVDWNDGDISTWLGPYYSGIEGAAHHTYSQKGTFTIHAKAKDSNGAESEWAYYTIRWSDSDSSIIQQKNHLFHNLLINRQMIIDK